MVSLLFRSVFSYLQSLYNEQLSLSSTQQSIACSLILPEHYEAPEGLLDKLRCQDMIKGNVSPRDGIDHVVVSVDAGCLLPSRSQLSSVQGWGRAEFGGGLRYLVLRYIFSVQNEHPTRSQSATSIIVQVIYR